MSVKVSITKGFYREDVVSGIFTVVKPYNEKAGHITILGPYSKDTDIKERRVKVQPGDFTMVDDDGAMLGEHVTVETSKSGRIQVGTNYEQAFVQSESDEDAMERIAETFAMLNKITDACARGEIRGLVVSGPPGIGKSFGVEQQLATANMFRTMAGKDPNYEFVTGGVSSIGLYQKLYYNRQPKKVLVFDDTDSILFDEECLTLLKGALNSGDKRRIAWNKESRVLAVEDIPDQFDFEGSIIFLSNIDFERTIAKGSRIAKHLEAIMSRTHYLDLEISSVRDQLLRIKQVCKDGMLAPYQFTDAEEASVISFVIDNQEHLREISLRAVKKLADFVKVDPTDWHKLAEATLLTRDARFKRLLDDRNKKAAALGVVLAAGTEAILASE